MKISIITATYNSSATIADCIASVKTQTCAAEHIIIDGASRDNTLETVRGLSATARIISEPDKGIYDAMNKGIAIASGEVIAILNSDDFYASPRVLEKVAKAFADESVDSCYGDLVYVKEGQRAEEPNKRTKVISSLSDGYKTTRYWESGEYSPEKFYWGWMPPHPAFFVRRRVYEKYGLFNLALGSAADYEIMLRFLLKHRITTVYIPEILVKMREGGVSNSSLKNRLKANRMDRKAWEVNGLKPYPWTLWMKPIRKIPQYFLRPSEVD